MDLRVILQRMRNSELLEIKSLIDDILQIQPNVLDKKLEDIDLSVRAFNCLKFNNIKTLGDIADIKENDFLKLRNSGRKSFIECKEVLASYGLKFKQ